MANYDPNGENGENTKSGGVEAAKADTNGEMVKSRNGEIAGFNTR